MKLVLKIVLIGVVALVLLGVAGSLALDPLLAKAIRAGVTHGTGTATELESADLGLTSGSLALAGLSIANPAGFRDEPFVALGRIGVVVEPASLFAQAIEIPSIELADVVVNVEAHGLETNYRAILDHLASLAPDEEPGDAPSEPAGGGQKSLHVGRILITDVAATLHLDVPLLAGSGSIRVPRIEIEDFRTDGTTGEIVAKLTRALIAAVLEAVAAAGGDVFPGEIFQDLQARLGELRGSLGEGAEGIIDALRSGESGDSLREQVDGAAREVEQAVGGLKDLLKKKD